jgi:hypothetical protein
MAAMEKDSECQFMAGSTYRKLLLDSGQWKIQSLANVSLLAKTPTHHFGQ